MDPLELERAASEGASALITVSPELVDVVRTRYELPERTLVLGNLALSRDRVVDLPERTGPVGAPQSSPTRRRPLSNRLGGDGSQTLTRSVS